MIGALMQLNWPEFAAGLTESQLAHVLCILETPYPDACADFEAGLLAKRRAECLQAVKSERAKR